MAKTQSKCAHLPCVCVPPAGENTVPSSAKMQVRGERNRMRLRTLCLHKINGSTTSRAQPIAPGDK